MSFITALVIVSYCVLGALVLLAAIKSAPSGYEDETGFHLGSEPSLPEPEFGGTHARARLATVHQIRTQPEGARPPWPVAGIYEANQADAA